MDISESRNDGRFRTRATWAFALAAFFLIGFVTEASAQSGSSTVVVRARGVAGGESITLRVANSNVATWTLTTTYQTFSASTTLAGAVSVAFTNDGGSRDVQVDYIIVNGETRQSENQSSNTGFYANGACGGGSNSEWMHCNGAITYGQLGSSANSVVVRARGTAGTESVSLRIDNTNVATWTMTTSLQNYSASTNLTGSITVAFTNDATGRDVQVDNIVVNGTTRQAEAQSMNTGLYANGSCGGGSMSEWMHCNGVIGFGTVSGGGGGGGGQLPGFFVGNITTNGQVRSDFIQYWDQITPENEGKWGQVEPNRDHVQLGRPGPRVQLRDSEQHPVQAAHVHLGCPGADVDQFTERIRTGRGDRGMDPRLLRALPANGDDRRGQRGHSESPAGRVCTQRVR